MQGRDATRESEKLKRDRVVEVVTQEVNEQGSSFVWECR